MPTYLVERYLPGVRLEDVRDGVERCRRAAEEMRASGVGIRHLGSLAILEDETCLCRFRATDAAVVAEANDRAGFAYSRISLARPVTARRSPPGSVAGATS